MTCCVGLECGNQVIIGADSAYGFDSSYSAVRVVGDKECAKVFQVGVDMLFAVSGWLRFLNLVKYQWSPPSREHEIYELSNDAYIMGVVSQSLLNLCKDKNLEYEGRPDSGCSILLGYRGKLYIAGSDCMFFRSTNPFHAIGAGINYALGVMGYIEESVGFPDCVAGGNAVYAAIGSAIRFCPGDCLDPIIIKRI